MKNSFKITCIILLAALVSCNTVPAGFRSIKPQVLKDKIAGGWAGKMIGVTYGAPTEFRAQGRIYSDSIKWKPGDIKGSIWQDDLYVQLTFLMSMDKFGIDAPAKKFQEMFARAGYPLWHANMMARKNYYDSIFAPMSGQPEYNMHADDIDFQIEADYIGFMCPGMPVKAAEIADRIGHIMNYGDGVYGGIFVAALYSEAFFSNDIKTIIEKALRSIPAESDYSRIVKDVILLHQNYPGDWHKAWDELEKKWGNVDICGAGVSFNIDAKLNGAYIVLGLLYGEGDPDKTMEITTRCGQDSDCNPSNAMAVLGVIRGFNALPSSMKDGINNIADTLFINTTYSFNKAVESTYKYALSLVNQNHGKVTPDRILIMAEEPVPARYETAFPGLIFDKTIPVSENKSWILKGSWDKYKSGKKTATSADLLSSSKAGSEIQLSFEGTGISINGNWIKEGGKADVYIDGKLSRTIDTYYNFSGQEHYNVSLWHRFGLPEGQHLLKLVVKGEKRPEASGTEVQVSSVVIFRNGVRICDNYKFPFEK